jgi:1-acyl-sn-glycerol-3-phosphate acyltransferase
VSKPAVAPLPDPRHRNRVWRGFQLLMQNVFVFWLDYRARGMENLPATGALLLSNHQSFLDPLLIGLPLNRPISFVARHNLFQVPFVGWVLRNTYVMPINREAAGTASIREAVRRLQHGFLVGIFPEGTRSTDGRLGDIKPGFIALIRQGRVPVVPVGIAGAREAMSRGAILPRRGRVRIVFGAPLPEAELARLSARGHEQELLAVTADWLEQCRLAAEAWRLEDAHSESQTGRDAGRSLGPSRRGESADDQARHVVVDHHAEHVAEGGD